jgi:cytochrome c553
MTLSLLVLLLGCWTTEERAEEIDEQVVVEMQQHDEDARLARDAAVRGDVAGLRKASARLASRLPVAGLPADWMPHQDAVKAAALRASEAQDLATGALALGELGQACSGCHAASGRGPGPSDTPPPPAGEDVEAVMARHLWASDHLWRGMIRPDQGELDAALAMLGDQGVPGLEGKAANELDAGVRRLVKAVGAATDADRGQRYGELMATCGACHLLVGSGGPGVGEPVPAEPAGPGNKRSRPPGP